jgi:hypothetical protein
MLEVALEKANVVDAYTKDHFDTLEDDYLSPADWTRLRMIKDFLQPFSRATLKTQGDNARVDRVLFYMDALISCFKLSLVSLLSYPSLFTYINIVR